MLDSGGDSNRIMASAGTLFRLLDRHRAGFATRINGHENGDRKIGWTRLPVPVYDGIVELETVISAEQRRLFMNLTISGHHLEITPAMRSVCHHQTGPDIPPLRSGGRHQGVADRRQAQGKRPPQKAECNIHVKGKDIFAESTHADLYAAVDELADKLDRQVLRYKDKTQEHHHDSVKRNCNKTRQGTLPPSKCCNATSR
jgi:putative sigma-54 modulation protein